MSEGQERRIEALTTAAEKKKQEALRSTEKAINLLIKTGQPITVASVSREAGVSTSYIYKYPEIKDRIQELAEQQKGKIKQANKPQSASDKSNQRIIQTLRERIKSIEYEKAELLKQNQAQAGQIYKLLSASALADRLKAENAELKRQLDECRRSSPVPAPPPTDNPKVTPIDKGKTRGITDRIKDELDRLGIKLNSTLTRKIKAADEETVLNALAALEEAMGSGNVRNTSGFLVQAITEGWTKEDSPQQPLQRQPEIYTASPEPDEDLVPLDQLKQLFGGTDE